MPVNHAFRSEHDSVLQAFIGRLPAEEGDIRSEALVAPGGAWTLQVDGITDFDDAPMPFAAILDPLPRVVIVISDLSPSDEYSKGLREDVWGYAMRARLRVEMNSYALIDLATWSRQPDAQAWYATLRQRWRPNRVRMLLIVDRVPDPRGPRHHFYAEPITAGDHMFNAVVAATYNETAGRAGESKRRWLERLRGDGIYVIDALTRPIVMPDEFTAALEERATQCACDARGLQPERVVLCGDPVMSSLMASEGLPLFHKRPIPFPTRHDRAEFITGFREALPSQLGHSDAN